MSKTIFKGMSINLLDEFIQVGAIAPNFSLVKGDLSRFSLKDGKGKNLILNLFPSLDTTVCAASVRKFNQVAATWSKGPSSDHPRVPSSSLTWILKSFISNRRLRAIRYSCRMRSTVKTSAPMAARTAA